MNHSVELGATRVLTGAVVTDAHGGKKLSSIRVAKDGRTETLQVDALAMAGGFSPIIHLACHRGARPVWSDEKSCFLAPERLKGLTLAGSVNATDGIQASLAEGVTKSAAMVESLGFKTPTQDFGPVEGDTVCPPSRPLWSIPGIKGKAFVDYQNDVHTKDLRLAVQEGYGDVELAKRYTTNGMATDQGKTSNIHGLAIAAEMLGKPHQTQSARPPSGRFTRRFRSGR